MADEDTELNNLVKDFDGETSDDPQGADVAKEVAPEPTAEKPAPKKRARKPKAEKPAAQAKDVRPKGTTRIILEENDDIPPTGLYVGHNGRGYLIRTGVPVDVPNHILEILDHAEMSTPIVDPNTRQVSGYRTRLRFNYRRVS